MNNVLGFHISHACAVPAGGPPAVPGSAIMTIRAKPMTIRPSMALAVSCPVCTRPVSTAPRPRPPVVATDRNAVCHKRAANP